MGGHGGERGNGGVGRGGVRVPSSSPLQTMTNASSSTVQSQRTKPRKHIQIQRSLFNRFAHSAGPRIAVWHLAVCWMEGLAGLPGLGVGGEWELGGWVSGW